MLSDHSRAPGRRGENTSSPGRRLGSLIAAIFGLVYIEVNAGSLPPGLALVLRLGGAVAFVAVLIGLWRDAPPTTTGDAPGAGFNGRYWLIVACEAAVIVIGSAVLRGVGLGSATVAWVSVVVGIHFVALAAVWHLSLFRRLGAAIALCGAAGISAAAVGAGDSWVAGIGAVLPGALLLWAATRRAMIVTPACPEPLRSPAGPHA